MYKQKLLSKNNKNIFICISHHHFAIVQFLEDAKPKIFQFEQIFIIGDMLIYFVIFEGNYIEEWHRTIRTFFDSTPAPALQDIFLPYKKS